MLDAPETEFSAAGLSESGTPEEDFLCETEDDAVESLTASPELELLNDLTQFYLNEIGTRPLFTPEEEFDWPAGPRPGTLPPDRK